MDRICALFFLILTVCSPVASGADIADADVKRMVEHINQRFDDFFRRQQAIAERDAAREQAAKEMHGVREHHSEILEKAREDFIKARKAKVIDPSLEAAWEEQQKAWREQHRVARDRFVQKRDHVQEIESHGRKIPGMKEYDLED